MTVILGVDVDWALGYANMPRVRVYVDELPKHDSLWYEQWEVDEHRTLWLAVDEPGFSGYVNYFLEDKLNPTGYGGRTFTVQGVDRYTYKVKGPWSSRAAIAMKITGIDVADVVAYELNSRIGTSAAWLVGDLHEHLLTKGVELRDIDVSGERTWVPCVIDYPSKEEVDYRNKNSDPTLFGVTKEGKVIV